MYKNIITNKIFRSVAIWIVFSTALGSVIAFYLSPGFSVSFWKLFPRILIATYGISVFSAITGSALGARLRGKAYHIAMLINVPVTLLAGIIAAAIIFFIIYLVISPASFSLIMNNYSFFLAPLVLINITITLTIGWLSRQKNRKEELERNIEKIQAELARKDEPDKDFLLIREGGNLYRLQYGEIIYLSSHGKKTLAHTEDKDYEISAVMKKIDNVLPDGIFIRIHKQFIVNMRYISHIQYYHGGRYLLYLKDKDENTLPIGIKYTQAVKNKLGL